MGNIYKSNYNGLQVTFTARDYHGFTFIAGYTYSHALDDVGANWDFGAGSGLPWTAIIRSVSTRAATTTCDTDSRCLRRTRSPA